MLPASNSSERFRAPDVGRSPAMARILAALAARCGLSAWEIAASASVAVTTLSGGRYLDKLRSEGLIHVSGWRKNGNGFTTPLYSLGNLGDCPQPHFDLRDRDSAGLARIAIMLERHGPLSYRQAAAAAGLSPHTVKNGRYMEVLVAQGRAHIYAWRRSRRGPGSPIFAAGNGENAAPLPPLSPTEKSRNFRRRHAPAAAPSNWAQQVEGLAR